MMSKQGVKPGEVESAIRVLCRAVLYQLSNDIRALDWAEEQQQRYATTDAAVDAALERMSRLKELATYLIETE